MAHSLKVAVQMEPIDSINIDADSTFALMLEAQSRGHTLWHYEVRHLALKEGVARPDGTRREERLFARGHKVKVARRHGAHYEFEPMERIDLGGMDVVLMRQAPPFDMAYITATHMLEHIQPGTLVVNDPASVRNAPEKLFVTHFPDLMPPTLITSDKEAIVDFRARHKDIIVKPLFGNGGSGVFHITPQDENLGALLETFTALYREPVIVQRYLPEIRQGDKRIILIEGEAVGAVSRVPQQGEARANFHAGGAAPATELTKREKDIWAAIGPTLREQGLVFVGIDVIGDYMTEINVTSPTGIQEINRLNGVALEAILWDAIEARL